MFTRGIIFVLLPSLLFGPFHITFRGADIYHRTMMPIHNMATPLSETDWHRLGFGEEKVKGAAAVDSVLLDYLSPDFITCIVTAFGAGDYRVILGKILGSLCTSSYIVVARIFMFGETAAEGFYTVSIQPQNFYASFAIMVVYCVSILILRPHGAVRTCSRLFTLMNLVLLTHQSHVLQCPEFWVQGMSVTEEHLRAQVAIADRVYRFGVYTGVDEGEHLGISIHDVPRTWEGEAGQGGGAVPRRDSPMTK